MSIFSATRCVVNLVRAPLYCPPIAIIPPQIASLSPTGRSATVAMTPEKKSRGSGVNGRTWASRFFERDMSTQAGVTIDFIASSSSFCPGKSTSAAIAWVTSAGSKGIWSSRLRASASVAPFSRSFFRVLLWQRGEDVS